MTNPNRPMSVHRKEAERQRAAEEKRAEKAAKDAALSAEIEKILRESAAKVRHLIARENKGRRRVDPHFFIGKPS